MVRLAIERLDNTRSVCNNSSLVLTKIQEDNMKTKTFYLDPDKRDWEYDGHGVKRHKENFQREYVDELCDTCGKAENPRCKCENNIK